MSREELDFARIWCVIDQRHREGSGVRAASDQRPTGPVGQLPGERAVGRADVPMRSVTRSSRVSL
jgi:hypothetical protein